ncbi:hypothetical protein MMC20_000945 [Loxospora ochrophaea]|nr:hypothetical protein [Loxospora ochrophaea]
MARPRPQLSITLPRNFTFHYTDGEQPKTPERELPTPRPPSPQAYRIRRHARPSVIPSSSEVLRISRRFQDVPIPTIETPEGSGQPRPTLHQCVTEPAEGLLAPVSSRRFMTAPRTPSGQSSLFGSSWASSENKDLGERISRPMSACSIASDSSDDSDFSSATSLSLSGSCTSPESDAPDVFTFSSSRKGKKKGRTPAVGETPVIIENSLPTKKITKWTPEMDKHLWTTYMKYLQDPTVTPFKMLPGSAPPLGVCHRVGREARRSWRGLKMMPSKLSEVTNSTYDKADDVSGNHSTRESPDTIRECRSGSNTPTAPSAVKAPSWPKSGPSTRRRLRHLCRRKNTIAPHYQRLMQSRSPSPFMSSSRSQSRLSRMSSPPSNRGLHNPLNTRDIQISLTTSTAASMQPDGPLAQLSKSGMEQDSSNEAWFNDPKVPWASPSAIPSDLNSDNRHLESAAELPRLGSPFGHHTWGPSRSRRQPRPTTPRTQSDAAPPNGPSLGSPVHLHSTFPYPSIQKRRAQNQLEDELSPGGADIRRNLLETLFPAPELSGRRRVRSRGFSLGDALSNGNDLARIFNPPTAFAQAQSSEMSDPTSMDSDLLTPPQVESSRRLGSPISGINRRPIRGRHVHCASLSSYAPNSFTSIDQRLEQIDQHVTRTSDLL